MVIETAHPWRACEEVETSDNPVARELAPAGLRSRPKTGGRFAPQREQAPSPRFALPDRPVSGKEHALGKEKLMRACCAR